MVDLNNMPLNQSMVATIYKDSLVEFDAIPEIKKSEPSVFIDEWKFLGDNKRNILIAINYDESVYLPDDQLTFLTNILNACKISLGDVALLNLNKETRKYKEVTTYFKSNVILLFGITPAAFGLPIDFPHFQVQPFNNGIFLLSPPLEEIEKDKILKSKLWICLQRIFST